MRKLNLMSESTYAPKRTHLSSNFRLQYPCGIGVCIGKAGEYYNYVNRKKELFWGTYYPTKSPRLWIETVRPELDVGWCLIV